MKQGCCNHSQTVACEVAVSQAPNPGEIESTFRVSGADCSDEVEAIKKALHKIGIQSVNVNLVASTVTVGRPPALNEESIVRAIESTGVKVVENIGKSFFQENRNRIFLIA